MIRKARNIDGKMEDPHYFLKAYSLTGRAKVDGVVSFIEQMLKNSKY